MERPGLYVLRVKRTKARLPLLRLRVARAGTSSEMAFVVPALPSTDYLVHLTKDWARFSFADAEVASASIRHAGVIDLLRAIERPRVASRIRLSIDDDLTMRPLLRGIGPAGRALTKTMRALTLWGFGLNSHNLQRTPDLLSDFDAAAIAKPISQLPGKPRFAICTASFLRRSLVEIRRFPKADKTALPSDCHHATSRTGARGQGSARLCRS